MDNTLWQGLTEAEKAAYLAMREQSEGVKKLRAKTGKPEQLKQLFYGVVEETVKAGKSIGATITPTVAASAIVKWLSSAEPF